MSNDLRTQAIWEQIQTVLIFLERVVVQRQVIAFAIVIVLAWVLSDGLWYVGRSRMSAWGHERFGEKGQQYWHQALLIIEHITFPLLGILTLNIAIAIFVAQAWLATLLSASNSIFWFILIYRFLIALLYILIGKQTLRHYHYRLLRPLFFLLMVIWLSSDQINLSTLANIELLQVFSNPITVGSLFGATVSLYFLFNLAWATQDTLQGFIIPRTRIDPGALNAVLTLGRYFVISIGLLIVFGALGFDASTLAFIGGGLSIGIGFGLQTIVSNFISGLVLLFEQSLRPGDVVKVDGMLGTVAKLSIRATTVTTFDNIDIIVPNETLFTSSVTNYTQSSRVIRVIMTIRVSHDSDPKEVLEILLDVAQKHGLVLDDPEPAAFFQEFGESSLDFHLAIWVSDPMHMKRVPSDLRIMIFKQFHKHHIRVPYPQRDLHIRSGMPWLKVEEPVEIELPGKNAHL